VLCTLGPADYDPPRVSEAVANPLVAVVMGSKSDWATLQHADATLAEFGVPRECRILSAHRTPTAMAEYAAAAEGRGVRVIIAGAGGAAHLPGMVAAHTALPVIGVPVESAVLRGVDSLLSIVQMPAGIPVATVAIGKAGAINAALLAVAILAGTDGELRRKLHDFRQRQSDRVLAETLP
jgi:5-(carboxyamino)imidazole ribonucleotide mutase